MLTKALESFANWFSSAAGVWQTLFIIATLAIAEFAWPGMDPHGFWLLYWLTIWSGFTQNALAYVSRQADNRTDAVLAHLEEMVENETRLDAEQLEIIKQLRK